MSDNNDIDITLDDENENIDVNEENFIYINIPESVITEMQEEIDARSLITETGSQLTLEIDNTTYKFKARLRDKNGNVIYTSNEIDLPLESVVINGEYDSVNKKLILTLQNGNTIEIDVSDLISGLVSETQLQQALALYYTKTETDTLLGNKVDKVAGKGLSEKDFTAEKEAKLNGIEAEANKTIVDNELDDTSTNPVQNKKVYEALEEKQTEIEALQEENELLKSQIPTEDVSGESIDITDSSDLEFEKFEVEGNSKQVVTTGKNKFNSELAQGARKFADGTYYNNTSYCYNTTKIPVEAGETYTISAKNYTPTNSAGFVFYNNDTFVSGLQTASPTVTIPNGVNQLVYNFFKAGGININEVVEIQLEIGSTATPYEPYTGGTASPNPDYPQTIYSAGDDGSIKEIVVNDNFFDGQLTRASISSGSAIRLRSTNQLNVIPNENFTLSLDSAYNIQAIIYEYDENDERTQKTSNWNNIPYIFKTNSTTKKIRFVLRKNNDNELLVEDVSNVQLQKGSNVLPYVPHSEQNISIPCQQPMRSIGNVRDEFVKVNGTWYERHYIGIGTANSFGTISVVTSSVGEDLYAFACSNSLDIASNSELGAVASNIFMQKILGTGSDTSNINNVRYNMGIAKHTSTSQIIISIKKNYLTQADIQEFKTFLINNNFSFEYIKATPTDLPCTQAQIDVLETLPQLKSYRTTTHIYTNDTTPATVKATYRKDLTTMFDELRNAIISQGANV